MKKDHRGINLTSKPSGTGCVECVAPSGTQFNGGLYSAVTHPYRVPDNTWQATKRRWKVYSRCQPPDIGYLDNAARPHKVHAKSLKSRAIFRISNRAANLALSVRLYPRNAFRGAYAHRAGGIHV